MTASDWFNPCKVAVGPDGNIYALISGNDSMSNRIFEFTPDGRIVRTVESQTRDLAVDASGNLYYFGDLSICNVVRLDTSGKTSLIWYNDANKSMATGTIAASPNGEVYVSIFSLQPDNGNYKRCDIYEIGTDDSSRLAYSGNVSSTADGFSAMAVDDNGTIYGTSTRNQLMVISPDGNATTIGKLGSANGTFSIITDVEIGRDGYLYVAEAGNQRVQKLTTGGAFIAKWEGCGLDHFSSQIDVSVDKNGRVVVADGKNERIIWLDQDYSFGENMIENLKGQDATWGNVIAGLNYTTWQQDIQKENEATPTPGFSLIIALAGFFLAGIALCLRQTGKKR